MKLLINTVFITQAVIFFFHPHGLVCLENWADQSLGYGITNLCTINIRKNSHRALSSIHSKIIQHILTVMLDSLGIDCLGSLTIIYPNRFCQWKWTRNELGSQNYMGACFQAPCATPRQRLMETHHVSLINLIFQDALLTNHTGMYKCGKIIVRILIHNIT